VSGHVSDPALPRGVLLGVAGLLTALVIGAGLARYNGTTTDIPVSTPVAERDLRFEDQPDGGIAVVDARGERLITTLTGQNGFLRATLRGLAQQRKRVDTDERTPFRLTAWADGRLTLDDPVTGRHLELEAFGPTNKDVFVQFLPGKEPGR